MRFILTFLTITLLPQALTAWGFHDAMRDGTPVLCVTSRQSAMGGAWALPSSGAASVFLNPAELSMLDGAEVNATVAIIEWRSEVQGPLDFDHLLTGTGGAATLAVGTPLSDRLAVGGGITRVSDFGFNGVMSILEEITGNRYQVSSMQILDSQGSLWEACTGVSLKMGERAVLGISGGLRFGSGSYTCRNDRVDPAAPDDTLEVDWSRSDPCFHGGLLLPFQFGTFALSGTNGTNRYASRAAVGFQSDFELLNGSTLGVEFDISRIEDRPDYSGRLFAVFTEMIPGVRSTYSIGFNRPADHHRTAVSIGTGARIHLGKADLDLGVSWMSRSRAGSMFPEPFVSNIDDAGIHYSAGMNWRL